MKYLDLKLLLFLVIALLFGIKSTSQEFLTSDNFKSKIVKDIVAVEFWVDWNSSNEFADLSKLGDCEKYRVDIGKYPGLQEEYKDKAIEWFGYRYGIQEKNAGSKSTDKKGKKAWSS